MIGWVGEIQIVACASVSVFFVVVSLTICAILSQSLCLSLYVLHISIFYIFTYKFLSIYLSLYSPTATHSSHTQVPIKGDIEQIERTHGRTVVIVNEGLSGVNYALDEALIAFGTAVEDGAYDRAVDILESAAKQVNVFESVCVCEFSLSKAISALGLVFGPLLFSCLATVF